MIFETADRLKSVEEYYFSKKLEQIAQMRNQGIDVINLGIGSPDGIPPPNAIQAAVDAIQVPSHHGYATYRSSPELRMAIAKWYEKTYNVSLDPACEILPLLGSKEGILYLSMAYLNPGDSVLIPNPGYPAYASVANLVGAKIIAYDLTEISGWLPDLDALEKQDLSRCKLMWVNYPHMPTGQSADASFFQRLVDFAKRKKILLCNDNPYGLVLNETAPLSLLSVDQNREVSVELNSLSKSFNMAGWRVGLLASSKAVVDAVVQVKSNVDSGMFLPIQKGAVAALSAPNEWHNERNETYARRRKIVWEIFDLLHFQYSKTQVGLFVWAKAPDLIPDIAAHLDHVLEKARVFLTPGMIFGSNGTRFARASLCANEDRLKDARDRIREFCK